jgi:hypothetical protein
MRRASLDHAAALGVSKWLRRTILTRSATFCDTRATLEYCERNSGEVGGRPIRTDVRVNGWNRDLTEAVEKGPSTDRFID